MTARTIVTLTLAAAATLGAISVGAHIAQVTDETSEIRAQTATITAATADLRGKSTAQAAVNTDLRDLITDREAILTARPAFIAAVTAAREAFNDAPEAVDVTTLRKQVLAAQEKVVTASTVDVMNDATVEASAAAATAKEKTAQWRAQQAAARASIGARGLGGGLTVGTGLNVGAAKSGWFAELRSILNKVGGSHITLKEYDGNCGGVNAPACSFSNGWIGVTSALAPRSYSYKVWVMTHELAHHYQFTMMTRIKASATYQSMFGSNIELLANCMAYAHGSPRYGHTCSTAQVNWSASIWRGALSD